MGGPGSGPCSLTPEEWLDRRPTARQLEVLTVVHAYTVARGFPPSIRDIARLASTSGRALSPNGVCDHLNALERRGLLTRQSNTARGFLVTDKGRALLGVSSPADAVALLRSARACLRVA